MLYAEQTAPLPSESDSPSKRASFLVVPSLLLTGRPRAGLPALSSRSHGAGSGPRPLPEVSLHMNLSQSSSEGGNVGTVPACT